MNRYLAIPLVLIMLAFGGVFWAQSSQGRSLLVTSDPVVASATASQPGPPLISFNEARTLVLDQWPTQDEYHLGSRIMPRQSLYATMGRLAEYDSVSDSKMFLASLRVFARGGLKNGNADLGQMMSLNVNNGLTFPVYIDRQAKAVHVFDQDQWHPYDQWRTGKLAHFKSLTGWGAGVH